MEILHIIDAIAREKALNKDIIITALEEAIKASGHKKYGNEHNIKAEINRKTGDIKLYRILRVVENVNDTFTEISFEEARQIDSTATIGSEIHDSLPSIDLGRVSAQIAKQVVISKVKEAEQEKQYNDFKNRVGEVLNGVVKRIEFGNVIVELGKVADGIIKQDQLIKGDNFKINDRVKACVQSVKPQSIGPQIFLSRTDNQMLITLLSTEVPEIYDQLIHVKAIARDPGSRSKIAVFAVDTGVDPVGSCVGIKGSRIRSVTQELSGEKIDVILWSNDIAQFVVNSLKPVEVIKVIIDESRNKIEVVVPEKQLTEALGRRGQNIKLVSKLVGRYVDVMTEEQESKRRLEEFNITTQLFMEELNIEEIMSQLLVVKGFSSLEQIATIDLNVISNIEGFDADIAMELQKRAVTSVENKNQKLLTELEVLGVEQELLDNMNLKLEYVVKLAEYGIKTLEDLEELSVEEFNKVIPNSGLSNTEIKYLIETNAKKA